MPVAGEIVLGDVSTPASFFETLKAERDCWNTYLAYFEAIDQKQPCQVAANCFTEDVEIVYHMKGPPLVFRSRAEYLSFLEMATPPQEMTAHVVGQHRFAWVDGRPRLFTYVTSWQWFVVNAHLGDTRPADFTTIGYSVDDFEHVDAGWLIARRHARPAAGLVAAGKPPPPMS